MSGDNWADGAAYELFMGRWSALAAAGFLPWLAPAPQLRWLDIGCGTGALSEAILRFAEPDSVFGCDPSPAFVETARAKLPDPRMSFQAANFEALPGVPGGFGGIVSGLVLNFIPEPVAAIRAMMRLGGPGTLVAAYVWDYAGRMDYLRAFWEEAVALDPAVEDLDEGRRFPLCNPDRLAETFREAGLARVATGPLNSAMTFPSFSAYWEPFLAGTGPAPSYLASLEGSQRNELAARLKRRLEPAGGGQFELTARAWAVRGEMPGRGAP